MDTLPDKKKRRSKKDSDGRSYTCDCGKSYLSYQALYTHKRTKHTELLQITETPKKKRGRPKGLKTFHNEFDPSFPLGDTPLARKVQNWKDIEKTGSCDDAFAEYLVFQSKKVLKKEYKSLASSIISLRDCINKNFHTFHDGTLLEIGEEYTRAKPPESVPKISNVYVIDYLPKHRPDYDKNIEVRFMLDFSNWLTEMNYTDLEVSVLT